MYCEKVECWQPANCPLHGSATEDAVVTDGAGMLQDSIVKVDNLRGRFHVLGLKLARKKYLSVGLGTSNSLTVGLVPFDPQKAKAVELGPEPGLMSVGRLILRMARSAHLFSSEMELAGFQLVRISVSVSGIGFAIPSANAKLSLKPSGKAAGPPPPRPLLSRVLNSPLDTLRNLSHQALAMADNFKAIGFELGTLSKEGGWLALTVGTSFGISVGVLPIKQISALHGVKDPVKPLPVKHLTAFQSVLLSLLLRANQTVSFLLGGRAEVGMITLKVGKLGLNIPQVVARVTCVTIPDATVTIKVAQNPAKSDMIPGLNVMGTPEEVERLQRQLTEKLSLEVEAEVGHHEGPPTTEEQKGEVFIQEMEERHGQSPVDVVGGHGPSVQSPATPAGKETGPRPQVIPAAEQPQSLDLAHPPVPVLPEPPSAGRIILESGKNVGAQVGSLFSGVAHAVVGGLGKSLGAVQSVLHRNNQEEEVKGVLEMGQTVGTQVQRHGFRLSYPDWLEVTIGTVVGCEVCVEPVPKAETTAQPVSENKEEPVTGQAAALLKMFVKAAKSVESAAVTLQQNSASLNSIDLIVDNVGLGIPQIGVAINLDRK